MWMARLFRLPRTGLCPQEGTAVGGQSAGGHEPGSRWRAGDSCRLGGQPEGATLNALGFLPPACGARGVAEGLLMVMILRAGPCGNVLPLQSCSHPPSYILGPHFTVAGTRAP